MSLLRIPASSSQTEVDRVRPDPRPEPERELLIPDRGEFFDALLRLQRGEILAHTMDEADQRCVLGGHMLYTAWRPLVDHGLLDRLPPDPRQGRMKCYRLSARGRAFADQAVAAWKRRPLWERLAIRMLG